MVISNIPNPPQPGRPISADWGRDVVRCLRSLWPIKGPGISFQRTPNGTVFSVAGQDSSVTVGEEDLFPFKVRWHIHGKEDDEGSWEVYLPWGCASVGGTACIPTNDQAKDADGNDEIGWFKFTVADSDSVETREIDGQIYRSFPVYALMKPWPHVKVSVKKNDYDDEPWLARKIIAYACIATWTDSGGSKRESRKVVQYVNDTWSETGYPTSELFAIRYDPDGDASDPETEWKAMLTNMTVTCGRFQTSSDDDEDVTGYEHVVLKIDHSEDGNYELSVQDTVETNDDDATYVTLYELEDGVVKTDSRTNITTMPFFDV